MNLTLNAFFSLVVACGVLLCGLRAGEVTALNLPAAVLAADRKALKDDQSVSALHSKVGGDIHHDHIEKQTLKSALKMLSDQPLQAEERHLKRVRHHARAASPWRRLNGVLGLLGSRTLVGLAA